MKKPQALEHFLSQHPEITEIEVCTDNDFAGTHFDLGDLRVLGQKM